MTGGGFGFGLLTDVQMLGFYQAQHSDGRKPFLAYVLQVATSSSHFLVYRRYSQIAGLAAKLHFHPPVGLPPKYALQVFPLTEAQLQQRFDGLQAFLSEVFAHLMRQHAAGLQHDASSFAGLDMQIFCDFISHHRNRPPKPVKSELPDWAKPSAVVPTMWADVESVTDSEDVGLLESDGDSEQEMEEEAEEETTLSTLDETQDPQSAAVKNLDGIHSIRTTGVEDTGANQSTEGEDGNESDDEAEGTVEEGTTEKEAEAEAERKEDHREEEIPTQHDEEPRSHMWDQVVPRHVEKLQEIAGGSPVVDVACGIYRRRAAAYKKDRAAKEKNDAVDGGREHTLALIDTDLPRTFPSLKLFNSSGPYYAFLLEVLETYACYRPDLGYIQGMSYLAAMLCLHMPQDRYLAFQCLANLMVNEHLFTFYLLDADLAGVYYSLFDTFLHTRHPRLHAHLKEIGVFSCSMYLMNWLQTLFLQVLPLELAARVFDNFLLDGTVFLFRTAMAIHELLAPELMAAEMDVALPLMQRNVIYQDTWNALVSEQSLFDTVETIAVPSHIYSALDRVVNDVFFYEKRGDPDASGGKKMLAYASGGQSVGIGHVKHERRRMYTISDALNGVLGGF
ncbi:hypothetical protein BBO99_00007961 [Phytophthora kernoviae]|uniref:Rab-GAP TBC domain-containing protein n=2 Tax=Phytophthora kernoviae TaxID=325452 RepID=A0A3R7NBV9_9STRA|nr:hypothetical protein G195_008454 [Phytophthora kernoviae 00238/432]KAG2516818.1 hypothetical protein JM16_007556 [Phytophthora kernoviae]KAG2519821.1 hypothetical protein JM18_007080 [Phytophthora kernoviae]RLN32497.1 hypothetical protein BBI17_007774 [Phytophthora kernoviae]RLN75917.1 hypothetical protein BBO99_00007961 [Phytophthora kernoviae]